MHFFASMSESTDTNKLSPQVLTVNTSSLSSRPAEPPSGRLQDPAASSQYCVPQESSMKRNPTAPKNKARKRSTFSLSAGDMPLSLFLSFHTFLLVFRAANPFSSAVRHSVFASRSVSCSKTYSNCKSMCPLLFCCEE